MHFNPEISLGALLELGVLVFACAGALIKLGKLEAKLNIMFDWFQRSVIGTGSAIRDAEDTKRFHGSD